MRRVGMDLALQASHRAVVYEDDRRVGKSFAVPHSKEGMEQLLARAVGDGVGPCEFVMEPTGLVWLPIAAELIRRGHKAYVPKPQKTRDLRRVLSRHTKTDGRDAEAAALLRHLDSSGVHELQVPRAHETTLRLFVTQRARLVLEGSRIKNRVQAWLLLAVPGLADAMGDPFSGPAIAYLRHHLDPYLVRKRGLAWLRSYWRRNADGLGTGSRADSVWQVINTVCEFYEELRSADKLPFDYAALQTLVRLELEHFESLSDQICEIEKTISAAYSSLDPDRTLEREVPGVGPIVAPTVEAYVGDIGRFDNVKQFAAFFGLVPRTSQTGGKAPKAGQRLTRGGPNLLKQYMFLAAESARRTDPELAATYERATAKGKHHYTAVIVVAHKLVRRIYALLRLRAAGAAARAAGTEPAPVAYSLRIPGSAEIVTTKEARAWVAENFPSKAAKRRQLVEQEAKVAATTTQQGSGSSEDATKAEVVQPPIPSLPQPVDCGKCIGQPVGIMLEM